MLGAHNRFRDGTGSYRELEGRESRTRRRCDRHREAHEQSPRSDARLPELLPVLSAQRSFEAPDFHRRGLTLLELLISLVLVGLMGGLIIGFLLKQERFYAGANEILQTR